MMCFFIQKNMILMTCQRAAAELNWAEENGGRLACLRNHWGHLGCGGMSTPAFRRHCSNSIYLHTSDFV